MVMSSMYWTEINFITRKKNANFGKLNFYREDGHEVWKFTDYQNPTPIQTEFFQCLSKLCTYL